MALKETLLAGAEQKQGICIQRSASGGQSHIPKGTSCGSLTENILTEHAENSYLQEKVKKRYFRNYFPVFHREDIINSH